MVVVMKVQRFEVEQVFPSIRIPPIVFDFKPMIGYLPVYNSIEEAKTDFPDGPFVEIKERE